MASLRRDEVAGEGATGEAPVSAYVVPEFKDVYKQEFRFVWRNARALGVQMAHLDDVVHDVFVVVHRRLHEFDGRYSIRSWLIAILVRVVHKHRRKMGRHDNHDELDDGQTASEAISSAGPLQQTARREAAAQLSELLQRLPEEQRVVFVLAELEEMSAPQIAEALETNVNTVYSRLRLAREAFNQAISRLKAKNDWR